MASTNTVQVKLPQGYGFQPAADALKRFGEVSHVTFADVSNLTLSVVFFDVRAADKALKALGVKSCKAGPQVGVRTVHLPSSAQVGVESIRGVSSVKPDPENEGSMILEFFDTRDAQRVQDLVDKDNSKPLDATTMAPPGFAPPGLAPPGLAAPCSAPPAVVAPGGLAAPPGLLPPPGLSLPKEKPCSQQEKMLIPQPPAECPPAPASPSTNSADQVEVLIKNLPEKLCSDAALLAIFEQGEIERHVLSYTVRLDSAMGEAHLWLKNRKAGKKCVKHFDGLPWDPEGSRVEAQLLTPAPEKAEKPEKKHKVKASQRSKAAHAKWPARSASNQVAIDQGQLQEAMAHFFSSPAGQKLLTAESSPGLASKPLPPGKVANIDWDDFSDWSEGEH